MSEQMPERSSGGGNVFTRKIGPLPMWGWMGIATLGAVGFALYKKNSSANATASSGAPSGTTDQSLVPQFVNQVYDQESPPAAPPIKGPPGPPGPTGPPGPSNYPPIHPPVFRPPGSLSEILTQGHAINVKPSEATIGWTIRQASPAATQLKVVLNGPGKKNETRYIPASATTAVFKGLHGGHTYTAEITPVGANGQAVGGPNNVTFVTSK